MPQEDIHRRKPLWNRVVGACCVAEVTPDVGPKITQSSGYGEKRCEQVEAVSVGAILICASSLRNTLLAYVLLGDTVL